LAVVVGGTVLAIIVVNCAANRAAQKIIRQLGPRTGEEHEPSIPISIAARRTTLGLTK
jgi:hypothetical protein